MKYVIPSLLKAKDGPGQMDLFAAPEPKKKSSGKDVKVSSPKSKLIVKDTRVSTPKAKGNSKKGLVAKKVMVSRGSKTFQQTVWVRPEEMKGGKQVSDIYNFMNNPAVEKIALDMDMKKEEVAKIAADFKAKNPGRKLNIDTVYTEIAKQQEERAKKIENNIRQQKKKVPKQGSGKEAHQKTKEEFVNEAAKRVSGQSVGKTKKLAESMHKYKVREAIKNGETVPPEVLKDYPDLNEKLPKNGSGDEAFLRSEEKRLLQLTEKLSKEYDPKTSMSRPEEYYDALRNLKDTREKLNKVLDEKREKKINSEEFKKEKAEFDRKRERESKRNDREREVTSTTHENWVKRKKKEVESRLGVNTDRGLPEKGGSKSKEKKLVVKKEDLVPADHHVKNNPIYKASLAAKENGTNIWTGNVRSLSKDIRNRIVKKTPKTITLRVGSKHYTFIKRKKDGYEAYMNEGEILTEDGILRKNGTMFLNN